MCVEKIEIPRGLSQVHFEDAPSGCLLFLFQILVFFMVNDQGSTSVIVELPFRFSVCIVCGFGRCLCLREGIAMRKCRMQQFYKGLLVVVIIDDVQKGGYLIFFLFVGQPVDAVGWTELGESIGSRIISENELLKG